MSYEIRWAKIEDAKALGYIHSKAWKIAYKNIIPDKILDEFTPEKREKRFKDALKNKKEETFVLVLNSKVIGFITLGKSRDIDCDNSTGEIWGLYLLPSYWGKGLGGALLSWGVKELASRGYNKITLWVLKDNERAIKFYEKMGFVFEGTIEQIEVGKKLDKARYVKILKHD